MTPAKQINTRQGKDRLTALLALAADRGEQPTADCLSADELAALLEGTCSAAEKAAAHGHLAGCQDCYDIWLQVSATVAAPPRRKKSIISLFQPKNLPYWGSALAVAASVVVFWHLRDSVLRTMRYELEPVPQVQQEQVLEFRADDQFGASDGGEQAEHAPSAPAAPEPRGLDERSAAEQPSKRVEKEERAPAPIAAPEVAPGGTAERMATPTASAPLVKAAPEAAVEQEAKKITRDAAALDRGQWWLQQVVAGCRAGESELQFWSGLRESGQAIIAERAWARDRQARMARVLELLQQIESAENVSMQCRQVMAYLAEPDESR